MQGVGILDLKERRVRPAYQDEFITDTRTLGKELSLEERRNLFVSHDDLVRSGRMATYLEYLTRIQPGKIERTCIVEQITMALTGVMNKTANINGGAGNNGKSSVFDHAKLLLGDYLFVGHAGCMSSKSDGATMTAMSGARGVVYDDTFGAATNISDARFKLLVANPKMCARGLYETATEHDNIATTIMLWNVPPRLTYSDPAIASRILYLPFDALFVSSTDPLAPAIDSHPRVFEADPYFVSRQFYVEYGACLLSLCLRQFPVLLANKFKVCPDFIYRLN